MENPVWRSTLDYQGRNKDPVGPMGFPQSQSASCPQRRLLIFLCVPWHEVHGLVHPDVGDGKVSIVSLTIVNRSS